MVENLPINMRIFKEKQVNGGRCEQLENRQNQNIYYVGRAESVPAGRARLFLIHAVTNFLTQIVELYLAGSAQIVELFDALNAFIGF